jgi:hypothetical protein
MLYLYRQTKIPPRSMRKIFTRTHPAKNVILLALVFYSFLCFSQIKERRFEKRVYFNGVTHYPQTITNTKDSGLAMLGNVETASFEYGGLTRFDKYGNLLWSNNYLIQGDSITYIENVINTRDNGFILCGSFTRSWLTETNYTRPVLIKIDSAGNKLWVKAYTTLNGYIYKALELSDSSIALILTYSSLCVIQKLDKNGNVIWSKETDLVPNDLKEKSNKHIVVYGDNLMIKEYDQNGNDVWEKKYSNPSHFFNGWVIDINKFDEMVVICDLMDAGATYMEGFYILKANSSGNIFFSKAYVNYSWTDEQTYAGGFTKDCGIVVNGRIIYAGAHYYQSIFKTDVLGNIQWEKAYPDSLPANSLYVVNTPDYGYASLAQVIPGNIKYTKIVKTDVNGDTPCNDSTIGMIEAGVPLTIDSVLHLSTPVSPANRDTNTVISANSITVIQLCSDSVSAGPFNACGPSGIGEITSLDEQINVYPNPSNGQFTFDFNTPVTGSMDVYNMLGEKVYSETLNIKHSTFNIDLSNNANGIYLYRVITKSGELIGEGKLIIEK